MRKSTNGFTLIELLIVIAIIIALLVFVIMNLRGQTARATDAKRKSDLYNLHTALEEYNNDHGSFPASGVTNTCGGAALAPYLSQMPCDPQTRSPYGYFPSAATGGYRVCAVLADSSDPAIAAENCSGAQGCGLGGTYNYCVASGTSASAVGTSDQIFGGGATPTPTPTPGGGGGTPTPTPVVVYACSPFDFQGVSHCNNYLDPVSSGCTKTYGNVSCNNECNVPGTPLCVQ